MELYLPPQKKRRTVKIDWSPEMLMTVRLRFPTTFNRELARELGVSQRSLVRKARDLGIDKINGFLEANRETITKMAVANNHNKYTGVKGWSVPNSESTRFRKGHIPAMARDPDLVKKVQAKRNETIKRDRIRMRLGLTRLTKFNLK